MSEIQKWILMKKNTHRERRNSYPENFFKPVKSPVLTENAMNLESLKTTSPVPEESLADIINRYNAKQAAIIQKLKSWQDAIHAASLKTMPIAEAEENSDSAEPVEEKGSGETSQVKSREHTF